MTPPLAPFLSAPLGTVAWPIFCSETRQISTFSHTSALRSTGRVLNQSHLPLLEKRATDSPSNVA